MKLNHQYSRHKIWKQEPLEKLRKIEGYGKGGRRRQEGYTMWQDPKGEKKCWKSQRTTVHWVMRNQKWLNNTAKPLVVLVRKVQADLRSTFKKQEVLKSLASQVYVLASSNVQSRIISFLTLPSAMISYFFVLWISWPFLNHLTGAFSLDISHSNSAVASSSTVWSSRGLVNSTGGSEEQNKPVI